MSEDDNTNGADDSAYSPSLINDDTISVPTSTSCVKVCQNPLNIAETPVIASPRVSMLVDNLLLSSNAHVARESSTKMTASIDAIRETVVSSTNMIEHERTPENDTASGICMAQSAKLSQPDDLPPSDQSAFAQAVSLSSKAAATKSTAPDISGLQLLSNSILAYEENTFIKKEPPERLVDRSPPSVYEPSAELAFDNSAKLTAEMSRRSTDADLLVECEQKDAAVEVQRSREFVSNVEPLGGLNLLCALAEQRFQEEVGSGSGSGSTSHRKRSSSSEGSESKRVKKHKEKHSIKKAKKKDRKEKKRRGSAEDVIAEIEFKETFDRVKTKYMKCNCRKTDNNESCCCHSNWLTPEQMYSAIKLEYRDRLAEITREIQEKKRKLENFSQKELRLQRESTPSSSKSSGSSSKQSTPVPTCSPSIVSTSSIDNCNFKEKAQSDSESCSSTSPKRKTFAEIKSPFTEAESQTKKAKSIVGHIFASKKHKNGSNCFSTNDEGSLNSDISMKRATSIKQEPFEFDESSSLPEVNLFSNFGERKLTLAETMTKNQKLTKQVMSKHHKKAKNNKERKNYRHMTEMRERKQRITNRCTLTEEHLGTLDDNKTMRVLTAMGGLFYAGCLSAVQPPDVYSVILDGERGNRPHIMSREEILRDAVSTFVIEKPIDNLNFNSLQ